MIDKVEFGYAGIGMMSVHVYGRHVATMKEVRGQPIPVELTNLMRAAPDMLTALRAFANAFGADAGSDKEMNGSDTIELVCELWPMIERAIAKAEGVG